MKTKVIKNQHITQLFFLKTMFVHQVK